MVVTYCTSQDVANLMGLSADFNSSTPSKTFVESLINMQEDYIDDVTNHAWRTTTITNERHHLKIEDVFWRYYTGITVQFAHRRIKDLDTNEGDKIEIWNGSEYEDYVTNREEGQDKDFWVDYENGILFVKTRPLFLPRPFAIRLTYRYGDDVKADIKMACMMLTAGIVLEGEDRSVLLPEGTTNVDYNSKINAWRKQAERIIENRKEISIGAF